MLRYMQKCFIISY